MAARRAVRAEGPELAELQRALGAAPGGGFADLARLAAAVAALPVPAALRRLEVAQQAARKPFLAERVKGDAAAARARHEARCAAHAAQAEQLAQRAGADGACAHYARVRELWASVAAASGWDAAQQQGAEEGRDRRAAGRRLEVGLERELHALLRDALGPCELVASLAYAGRPGEVDWAAVARDPEPGRPGSLGRVLAVIEVKAGCFELASGVRQQEGKLRGAEHLVSREGSWRVEACRVLVATVVPAHRFALGAEAQLLQQLAAVRARDRDPTQEEQAAIRARLACSPRAFLARFPDRVLVLAG